MLGDIGMGVLKLLTLGCCGILTIIDWFTVSKRAKEKNFSNVMTLICLETSEGDGYGSCWCMAA